GTVGPVEEHVDDGTDEQHDDDVAEQAYGLVELRRLAQGQPDGVLLVDDDQQLTGHEGTPGKGPALFEAGDEHRQSSRNDEQRVTLHTSQAHDLSGPQQRRVDVVDPGDESTRDGGGRAQDDDEHDRRFVDAVEQHRKGEPDDGGHRL